MDYSQMDTKGMNVADSCGHPDDTSTAPTLTQPTEEWGGKSVTIPAKLFSQKEFDSPEYEKCKKVGKAVIVCNFMEGNKPYVGKLEKREYAKKDCEDLEKVLKKLGFEALTDEQQMVHENLTKSELEQLYVKVAKKEDYGNYTCVLFIVMSYGMPGLIRCHPKDNNSTTVEYVEQKKILEAFQPQNNGSLAMKPKLFIIQTVPIPTTVSDDQEQSRSKITRKIPREADFLTYASESYCIDGNGNNFIRSVIEVLNDLARAPGEKQHEMEIHKLFIKMNNVFKKHRSKGSDWKIPCVTSSLTKQLVLF